MMQSEFTELTKIYVTAGQYAEIEKRYMEMNISKQEFCKLYKANKDGIQEACAREASTNEWKEKMDAQKEAKEWERKFDREQEILRNRNKDLFDANEAKAERIREWQMAYNKEAERANKAEEKVEALEQEIMMLKAKLYDMMMKGVA